MQAHLHGAHMQAQHTHTPTRRKQAGTTHTHLHGAHIPAQRTHLQAHTRAHACTNSNTAAKTHMSKRTYKHHAHTHTQPHAQPFRRLCLKHSLCSQEHTHTHTHNGVYQSTICDTTYLGRAVRGDDDTLMGMCEYCRCRHAEQSIDQSNCVSIDSACGAINQPIKLCFD